MPQLLSDDCDRPENAGIDRRTLSSLDLNGSLRAALLRVAGYADYLINDFFARPPICGFSESCHSSEALMRLSELSILVSVANRSSHHLPQEFEILEDILIRVSDSPFAEVDTSDILPTAQLLLYTSPANVVRARALLLRPGFRQLYRDPATELCFRHLLSYSRRLPFFHWVDLNSQLLCSSTESPELLRRCDVYSFTHEIFYLTNFGKRRLPSEVNTDVSSSIIKFQVQRTFEVGDDDLLMELLLAAMMCETDLPAWETVLSTLRTRSDERWFVRPNHSLLLANKLRDDHRRRYEFAAQYHPEIVWCLLLLSLASSESNPVYSRQ
ncbi:hypothetical protein SAMN04490239_0023 [Rhodococcus koreensis]|uniref:DUF6895 domain-containing protein n=2 Tax=Rhodococcus koreensis TaxID=99653 RepID=A0A1H4I4W3_9NOCA|nr:hypothetical protein SAMN04490239_0023 [Rhodococcus koreensis]